MTTVKEDFHVTMEEIPEKLPPRFTLYLELKSVEKRLDKAERSVRWLERMAYLTAIGVAALVLWMAIGG